MRFFEIVFLSWVNTRSNLQGLRFKLKFYLNYIFLFYFYALIQLLNSLKIFLILKLRLSKNHILEPFCINIIRK